MKIAININELTLKNETGVKVYTREIVNALGQVDKENEYILYANCRDEVEPRFYGFDYNNSKFKIQNSKFNKPFWTYAKLPREIKKDKPDVLFMPIQAAPFFKKPKNIKIVVTIHDLAFLLFPKHFTIKDRLLLNFHTKRAIKMVDKIIAPSEATKNDIIKFYGIDEDKIEVIYHGITFCHCEGEARSNPETTRANRDMTSGETEFEILRQAQDDSKQSKDGNGIAASSCGTPRNDKNNGNFSFPYLLFVGTIQPRKNLIRLIEAFEIFKNLSAPFAAEIPPAPFAKGGEYLPLSKMGRGGFRLIIAGGKGWMAEKIYQRAKESKFSNDIIFTGSVSDNDLINLYKNAAIFVLPSLYEGFGLPVLEAMSAGIPCVVSDNSSLREIAGDSALFVDAYNSNDIAEKMYSLLNNKELREDLSRRGIENAKKFSWIKAAEETLSVLSIK